MTDCDGDAEEMPELSDGDEDDDEEKWQWLEEEDSQEVNVTCLFCDRWDAAAGGNTANSVLQLNTAGIWMSWGSHVTCTALIFLQV